MTRKMQIEEKAHDLIKQSTTIGFKDLVAMAEWCDKNTAEMIQATLKAHHDSTKPMDDYFTGMYNGLECALCLIEHREPFYKDCKRRITN